MSKAYSKVLLITANVGSLFEEPEKMIAVWMQEFLAVVTSQEPEFLAIHCQEVGGKNYESTMQHVNKFIKMLLSSEEMQQFDRARVFLDEDFTAVEKFTALGSLYFVHHSVAAIEMFDFHEDSVPCCTVSRMSTSVSDVTSSPSKCSDPSTATPSSPTHDTRHNSVPLTSSNVFRETSV